MQGNFNDPRVAYEHSEIHDRAGSLRVFESLPLFAGRATLEGLYFQANLCSPFIYYLQSEISHQASMPFPQYNYSRMDLKRAMEHFKLFNVAQFIAVNEKAKQAADNIAALKTAYKSGPYTVYELTNQPNRYVQPLQHKPVLAATQKWRQKAYRWLRLSDLSVLIAFKDSVSQKERDRFQFVDKLDVQKLPKIPLPKAAWPQEQITAEEILIDNAPIGKPLLIKIAYHPNWKVQGADTIYLASPAFMLIFPQKSRVRIYYGRTWPDYLGAAMTGLALLYMLISCFYQQPKLPAFISRRIENLKAHLVLGFMGCFLAAGILALLLWGPENPKKLYRQGLKYLAQENPAYARQYFKQILDQYPQSNVANEAGFHYALSYIRRQDWENAVHTLKLLLQNYPDSRRLAAIQYNLGLSYQKTGKIQAAQDWFQAVTVRFPDEIWARYAADRLKEIHIP